jgi:hypothetical protein
MDCFASARNDGPAQTKSIGASVDVALRSERKVEATISVPETPIAG